MAILDFITGAYFVKIVSASATELIKFITNSDIALHSIQQVDYLTFTARIARRDYALLQQLITKKGDKISIIQKEGLIWNIATLFKRPILTIGALTLVFLSLYLPTKVLFIQVEGNRSVSTTEILESAEKCGITFGASRRKVRSERVKNALLSASPQLQWAGINTNGCVAVISVRERSAFQPNADRKTVSSIVAMRDGIISELTVLQGSPQCRIGQAVKKGQILVSGYTDCGITIRAEQADAEIMAKTFHNFQAISPIIQSERTEQTHKTTHYMLCIGKKLINLCKCSGIFDGTCVKMYEKIPLILPGGFVLPITMIKVTCKYYDTQQAAVEETDLSWLQNQADSYLQNQMISGQILLRNNTLSVEDGQYLIDCRYACREMIGAVRYEEMITSNE